MEVGDSVLYYLRARSYDAAVIWVVTGIPGWVADIWRAITKKSGTADAGNAAEGAGGRRSLASALLLASQGCAP
jgi:hypothetical protein